MIRGRRLVFVGTLLLASTLTSVNSIDFIGLAKMPNDLGEYVRQTISYSPELQDNLDISAAISEGRFIAEHDYAVINPEKANKSLHLVLCELKTKAPEALSGQERDRSNTITEGDISSFKQAESNTTTNEGSGESSTNGKDKIYNVPLVPNASMTSSTVTNENAESTTNNVVKGQSSNAEESSKAENGSNIQAKPQAKVPIMSQESHVICLYFHEFNFGDSPPIYTLIHVGVKVVGPIRRALADLIERMQEKKFKNSFLKMSKYLEKECWGQPEWKAAIRTKTNMTKTSFPKATVDPILYLFAGKEGLTHTEHAIVYKVTKNGAVQYVAAAHRESTDPAFPSVDLMSSTQHLTAWESAAKMLDSEWKTVVPPLRISKKDLKDSSLTSSGSSGNAKSLVKSDSTKINLRGSLGKLTGTTDKWDFEGTRSCLKSRVLQERSLDAGKVDFNVIVTLRPKREPEHMANWEPVAFVLCRLVHPGETKYVVALLDNITANVPSIRMLLNDCSIPSAALVNAGTFFDKYLFWSKNGKPKFNAYAEKALKCAEIAELPKRLEIASEELLKIVSMTGTQTSPPQYNWSLAAATEFTSTEGYTLEVFVVEYPNIAHRSLYTVAVRKVLKQSSGRDAKKSSSSSKTDSANGTVAISPFYFNLSDILNRPKAEFEAIYVQNKTDIIVACDLSDMTWWEGISERIVGEVEDELEFLPYPMLSLDSMKVTYRYALYPALVQKEHVFGVKPTTDKKQNPENIPTHVLCQVQCGLGLGYYKYFGIVLEDPALYTLRLVTNHGSTVQGSVKDVLRFEDDYVHWDQPGKDYLIGLDDEIKFAYGKALKDGMDQAVKLKAKLEGSSMPVDTPKMLTTSQQKNSAGSNPAISETAVPAISETAVPAISETAVPAITETAVPAISETAVPANSEPGVPAISEPAVSATETKSTKSKIPPQNIDYLSEVLNWNTLYMATYGSDGTIVLVLEQKGREKQIEGQHGAGQHDAGQHAAGPLALLVYDKNKKLARLVSFCYSFNSIRNKTREEFDRELGGGFSEYNMIWKNKLMCSRESKAYFLAYRTSEVDSAIPNILVKTMKRALPPNINSLIKFGRKRTKQDSQADDFYFMYELSWQPRDNVVSNRTTQICLVQLKTVGFGGQEFTVREKARFFKNEDEARDYALMYDSRSD